MCAPNNKAFNESTIKKFEEEARIEIPIAIYNNKVYVPILFITEHVGYLIKYIQDKNQTDLSIRKDNLTESVKESGGDKLDTRVEVEYDGTFDFKYIKPSNDKDIESQMILTDNGKEVEIRYIKNQIIFLATEDAAFEEIKKIAAKYDGMIVGYVARTHRYQVEFLACTYNDLQNKMKLLREEKLIKTTSIQLNDVVELTTN